jgi:lipopolysaccharide export system protein LptC
MAVATSNALPRGLDLTDITQDQARSPLRAPGPGRNSGSARAALARGGAFSAADRHSRRVRFLKFAVPSVAALCAVGFVLYTLFDPFRALEVKVDVGTVNVNGDRLTMELPRLTGFNKQHEAYNVTAKTASQKLTAPGLIDLTDLEAIISTPDKSKATLRALTGRFDSNAELLTLNKDVTISSTSGYSAALSAATVDFKAGTVNSDAPVKVTLENGVVEAGALSVKGGGDVITFRKGVSTRFVANGPPRATSGTTPQPSDIRGTTQ